MVLCYLPTCMSYDDFRSRTHRQDVFGRFEEGSELCLRAGAAVEPGVHFNESPIRPKIFGGKSQNYVTLCI
jgi:hypothetical protein